MSNVSVVRREKLWERRRGNYDSSKVRNNGLLKRVSKIFFFSGFQEGFEERILIVEL